VPKVSAGQKTENDSAVNPLAAALTKLDQAELLRRAGQFEQSYSICRALLERYPNYFAALYTAGLVCADRRDYQQALNYLVRAVMLNPENWSALTALSGVYLRLGAHAMAAETVRKALAIRPRDASVLLTLGEIYREDREYELAAQAYLEAMKLDSSLDIAKQGVALSYSKLGRTAEAATLLEQLIAAGNRDVKVLLNLAQMPPSLVKADLLSLVKEAKRNSSLPESDFNSLLDFFQAAALDKSGRIGDAWKQWEKSNRSVHAQQKGAWKDEQQRMAKLLSLAGQANSNSVNANPADQPLSLFILGPSRAGKSTAEGLMGEFAGVKLGFESPAIENAVKRTFHAASLPTKQLAFEIPPNLDHLFREQYVKELKGRAPGAKVFVSTSPGRIRDANRLAQSLPSVRFLLIKRDRHDNALRIYQSKYSKGHSFAYDLSSIYEYLDWYHAMMETLARKFPSLCLATTYEEIVADPRQFVKSVAEFCELPFVTLPQLPDVGDDRACAGPYRQFMVSGNGVT
jgi:tetratricopeptide (TPR) repeat protein